MLSAFWVFHMGIVMFWLNDAVPQQGGHLRAPRQVPALHPRRAAPGRRSLAAAEEARAGDPDRRRPAPRAGSGAAGAGVLGRNALARIRKIGAAAERRREIDAATHEANALRIFDSMGQMKGAFMKLGQMLSQQAHTLPEAYVRRLAELQWEAPPMHGTLMRMQFRNETGPPARGGLRRLRARALRRGLARPGPPRAPRDRRERRGQDPVPRHRPLDRRATSRTCGRCSPRSASAASSTPRSGGASRRCAATSTARSTTSRRPTPSRNSAGCCADRRMSRIPRVYRDFSTRRVLTMERARGAAPARLPAGQARPRRSATARRPPAGPLLPPGARPRAAPRRPASGQLPVPRRTAGIGLLDFGCSKRFDPELRGGAPAALPHPARRRARPSTASTWSSACSTRAEDARPSSRAAAHACSGWTSRSTTRTGSSTSATRHTCARSSRCLQEARGGPDDAGLRAVRAGEDRSLQPVPPARRPGELPPA